MSALAVFGVLFVVWYASVVPMNADVARTLSGDKNLSGLELVSVTMSMDRPVLPSPHQVAVELWDSTVGMNPTSKRSLVFHAWKTLAPTALGFLLGMALGMLLAVSIVVNKAVDKSVMPWVIASQTIPILAIAPMIIVILGAIGLTGLVPKAIISMYLAFFPITIGMVKGLRSPDPLLLDLMRSYSASQRDVLVKLRLPASIPYLFASMKVGVAASLVGTIVGELPTGAQGGLGARLLVGSYYGQTVQIWAALLMAAAVGATLVGVVGLLERKYGARMGGHAEKA